MLSCVYTCSTFAITGSVAPIGITLATRVMQSPLRLRSLPELRCFSNISDLAYVERIPALYSMNSTEIEARDAVDVQVAKAAGELSVDSFARVLTVIGEGIRTLGFRWANAKPSYTSRNSEGGPSIRHVLPRCLHRSTPPIRKIIGIERTWN
ncbi:hypothetical protein BKA82DRAFT_499645 [Pisolithus tinctorius]|uniref:Uncharacterized protein n=1 Tax=Pisolithus tinctorius Marx 270 TaxID=870435 RepID=A0A0C3PEF5_PISTI|nr:hypothetical protein BKA82DRAFT_499645 [Pisolithus tinctorius]KIO06229.1 hypothetical protein M404DRAFT_499645 [Pisolithus tinctorius Marx 270]